MWDDEGEQTEPELFKDEPGVVCFIYVIKNMLNYLISRHP